MLGLPAPGSPATVATDGGDPFRTIEQSGWRVGYGAFRTVGGVSLPARFTASSGAVRLKVTVDRWGPPSASGGAP